MPILSHSSKSQSFQSLTFQTNMWLRHFLSHSFVYFLSHTNTFCYATKGLVYIKRNVYIPTRVFMLISAEPLDFVLWRRERIQEKAAQTCLVYTVLYRAYKFHTSIELDFKWRRSSFFSLFKWYFVEAQPGMIFYALYLLKILSS